MFNKLVSWMIPAVPRKVVRAVAKRYIAGDTIDSAIDKARELAEQGFVTTLDMLGEDIETFDQAEHAAAGYVTLIDAIAAAGIERNVSIKLSQLGFRLDPDRAFDQLRRVLDAAAERDAFVRFDMEDSSVTDLTIEFYRRAREIWPRVGTVLQARLHRTVADARELGREGANLRLVKGIYIEPRSIAYTGRAEIREAFMDAALELMNGDGYLALATHDERLIERLEVEITQQPVSGEDVEFQALLGVPMRTTLARLTGDGRKVRIYVPFGNEWYAYSVRRLKENPQMAGAITKGLFKRG